MKGGNPRLITTNNNFLMINGNYKRNKFNEREQIDTARFSFSVIQAENNSRLSEIDSKGISRLDDSFMFTKYKSMR